MCLLLGLIVGHVSNMKLLILLPKWKKKKATFLLLFSYEKLTPVIECLRSGLDCTMPFSRS